MKNGNARFVFCFLAAAACVFVAACKNPIVETWWGDRDGAGIAYIPGDTVVLARGVRIFGVFYIEFSGNSIEYNGGPVAPAVSDIGDPQRDANDEAIGKVLEFLDENPDWLVQVTGHANPTIGSIEEAAELHAISAERARAVMQVLMGANSGHPVASPASRARIIDGGYSDSLFSTDQNHGEFNRCVELIVLEFIDP